MTKLTDNVVYAIHYADNPDDPFAIYHITQADNICIIGTYHDIYYAVIDDSGFETINIEASDDPLSFFMKWDGCAHFNSEYQHTCGRHDLIKRSDGLDGCYFLASKIFPLYDGGDKQDFPCAYEPDFTSAVFISATNSMMVVRRLDPARTTVNGLDDGSKGGAR